jgi:hypothetical protein
MVTGSTCNQFLHFPMLAQAAAAPSKMKNEKFAICFGLGSR